MPIKPICFLYEFITKCPQYIPDAVEAFQENFRSLLQDDFPAIALKFLKSENADSTEDAERKDSILMMMNFIACELSKFLFQ